MRIPPAIFILIVGLSVIGSGCRGVTLHQKVANRLTEYYAYRYVRPLTDPIAFRVHRGEDLPRDLVLSNRVTLVELIPHGGGDRKTLFDDETRRPPNDGMVTGVDYAHGIGLFFPVTHSQPDIEVRVNYHCELGGDFVAVHVVVPNPLLVPEEP